MAKSKPEDIAGPFFIFQSTATWREPGDPNWEVWMYNGDNDVDFTYNRCLTREQAVDYAMALASIVHRYQEEDPVNG